MDVRLNSTMIDPLIAGWQEALSHAVFNDAEGLYMAPLKSNDMCSLFIACLPPSKKIPAHVHYEGQELYYIIRGKGLILTAEMQGDSMQPLLSMPIEQGESFGIPEGMGHELKNIGSEDLIFILATPPSHLTTDRHVISDIVPKKPDPFFESSIPT